MTKMDHGQQFDVAIREDRRARLIRGSLKLDCGAVIPLVVRNLSTRGLGVRCLANPPALDRAVKISLPGSPELDGVVRWKSCANIGIELGDAVDLEALATTIRVELARSLHGPDWTVSRLHHVATNSSTGSRRTI